MSGEQLAHPAARSMSLPFDALLSGAAEPPDFPDDEADANLATVSRRFSSDPAVPSAVRPLYTHHSQGSYRNVRSDSRPSRKERVKALALWYDRMANRSRVPDDDDQDDDNVLLPTDSNQKLASRAGSWGYSVLLISAYCCLAPSSFDISLLTVILCFPVFFFSSRAFRRCRRLIPP